MGTYKFWALEVLLLAVLVALSGAASIPWGHGAAGSSSHEIRLWKAVDSNSKFLHIPHSVATCESTTAPEPLATPAPLIDEGSKELELSVSFVIGTDGLVHSALLLKSVGDAEDRAVLNTVRSWRYRPAMCNGVPTETEATVDFSSRRRSFGLK